MRLLALLSALLVVHHAGCEEGAAEWAPKDMMEPDYFQDSDDGSYQVVFDVVLSPGKKGVLRMMVYPEWAPLGAARFRELVETSFFDGCRFFRVIPGFMAQFGISGNPTTSRLWKSQASLHTSLTQVCTQVSRKFHTSLSHKSHTRFTHKVHTQVSNTPFAPPPPKSIFLLCPSFFVHIWA